MRSVDYLQSTRGSTLVIRTITSELLKKLMIQIVIMSKWSKFEIIARSVAFPKVFKCKIDLCLINAVVPGTNYTIFNTMGTAKKIVIEM